MKTVLVLLSLLCPLPAWALMVTLHEVPPTAEAALRTAWPQLEPVAAGAASATRSAVHLFWRAETYQLQQHRLDRPALVLMAYPGQAPLRAQDTALYWAPDLQRQLALAETLHPRLQRVGVITRAATRPLVDAAQRARPDIQWIVLDVELPLKPREVAALAAQTDVLIAVPDEMLFSPALARVLLTTAYRHRRAWIGPNAAYVRAGAAATWQVSRTALTAAVVDALRHWDRHQRWPGSRTLPADERLLNRPILRSLDLRMPPEDRP